MSTVFRFGPGETEKQLKFGSDSEAVVVVSDSKICAGTVHPEFSVSADSAGPAFGIGAKEYGIRQ
jgi:hypothetical protein